MTIASYKTQILDALDDLSSEQQAKVLHFTQRLRATALPSGTPGEVLLARMDTFHFEPGDLEEMAQAIEEGCGRIDWDGWQPAH